MNLSQLKPPPGQKHKKQRVGHGMGSGRGKVSGRGMKGAKSVSGYSRKRGFEGGQMPIHRRLPKRGFNNIFRTEFAIVNVGRLERLEGDSFDPETLLERGVIRKLQAGLKILGTGELTRKLQVKAHQFSKSALEKIQAAGGTAEVIAMGGSRGGGKKTAESPGSKSPAKGADDPKAGGEAGQGEES